jgi:hypothetical protein
MQEPIVLLAAKPRANRFFGQGQSSELIANGG